ncbi:MAG: acetylxylan esterase [Candidatus Paceibacteria bacterium]
MIRTLVHWLRRGGGLLLAPFLTNHVERDVRPYTLPGIRAGSASEWNAERRGILRFFESEVYGAIPNEPVDMKVEVLEEGSAFDEKALRRQVALTLSRADHLVTLNLLIYTPVQHLGVAHGGAPVVLAYNLEGNHTIHADPAILPSRVYAKRLPGVVKRLSKHDRGRKTKKEHLPVERLVQEGFAVATLYYGDVDPDYDDWFKNGAHALYPELPKGSWGSISAWAWGLSRVMDYLETETGRNSGHAAFRDHSGAFAQILISSNGMPTVSIDPSRVALFGFSRLGKAALWAAANDERFAAVIVDSPGKGGAALARRRFGETVRLMTLRFPHWFNNTYKTYTGREDELPMDQHQLLALISPRPVLVSSADMDWWSDPVGEQAAVAAAQTVYRLYDAEGPEHVLHRGGHAVTEDEWDDYFTFLRAHL